MEEKIERFLKLLLAFAIAVMLCGLITVLAGCRSVKYVSVPEYHTEYRARTDSFVRVDSVWVHDSVSVWMRGDTVYREKWAVRYRDRLVYKMMQDTLLKTDSVRVPMPVERKVGKWEQVKSKYFLPVTCVCGILFVSLLWLIKRKT